MRYIHLSAAAAALCLASPALAQEGTAPDGTPAFGFEPYAGVMGGYHDFDSDNRGEISTACNGTSGCPDGGFIEAVAGVNVPLGPVFVGAEGNIAKGFNGIDYEYGAYGRFGIRAGDSGLVYGKVGYQWVKTDESSNGDREDDDIAYGVGIEAGPSDIGLGGLTGNAGIRLRLELNTFDLQSFRPSAGVIFHF